MDKKTHCRQDLKEGSSETIECSGGRMRECDERQRKSSGWVHVFSRKGKLFWQPIIVPVQWILQENLEVVLGKEWED